MDDHAQIKKQTKQQPPAPEKCTLSALSARFEK